MCTRFLVLSSPGVVGQARTVGGVAGGLPHPCGWRLRRPGRGKGWNLLTFKSFNDLRFHSNASKKVIDTQCTFVLSSRVFACTELRSVYSVHPELRGEPRSAATQPRTVLTSLATDCTPPCGSNSHRNVFRINTYKSLSKQTTLTLFRINTYEKQGGGAPPIPREKLVVAAIYSGASGKKAQPAELKRPNAPFSSN